MAPYPGFIGGSATSQSVVADAEQTVNWYVEVLSGEGAKGKKALYPTPGFASFITGLDSTNSRAGIEVSGRAFVVVGPTVYEIFATGSATARGTVVQDSKLAQIVHNGAAPPIDQLLIASGGNAYCYEMSTNVLTQVLTGLVTQVSMIDGYFLALQGPRLRLSDLQDGTSWDPTQVAIRTTQADPWIALIVNTPDIILLGARTGDVWYNAGLTPFPLAARTGLTLGDGIVAPWSLAYTGSVGFWLTENKDGAGLVVQAQGYSPQKVSSPELDTAIARYQRERLITDAEALIYQKQGHTFYVLRFPSANATWAYDLTTGSWAERGKWNAALNQFDVWAPRMHLYAFGLHITGDAETGILSQMDVGFPTETDGTVIRRVRRGGVLVQEGQRLPLSRFELLLEAGLGNQSNPGQTPVVMLRTSPDAKTWTSQRQASTGKVGQYKPRVFWTRLGSPRLFVPEVTVSDPIVNWRIVDAYLNNG